MNETPKSSAKMLETGVGFNPDSNAPYQKVIDRMLLKDLLDSLPDNAIHIDFERGLGFQSFLEVALKKQSRGIGNIGLRSPQRNIDSMFSDSPKSAEEYLSRLIKSIALSDKADGISMLFPPIPKNLDIKDITSILPSFIKDGGILILGKPFFKKTLHSELDSRAWDEWRKRALTNLGVSHKESDPSEDSDPLKEDKKLLEEAGLRVFSENWQNIRYSHEELVLMSQDSIFIREFFQFHANPNELPKITKALIDALEGVESLEIGYHKIIARKEIIAQKPVSQTTSLT